MMPRLPLLRISRKHRFHVLTGLSTTWPRYALPKPALAFPVLALAFLLAAGSARAEGRVVLLLSPDLSPLGTGEVQGSGSVTGIPALDALARDLGVVSIDPFYPGTLRTATLVSLADRLRVLRTGTATDPDVVAEAFAGVPGVLAAEVPSPARLLYTPNDPAYASEWYLPHVNAPLAWDFVRDPDTRESVVAVIDTGLDFADPDLSPSVWINTPEDIDGDGRLTAADRDNIDQDGNGFVDDVVGWDFAANDPDPQETHWHGSGVGASISAATDNGIGIAGIGFGVRLMVLKAFADGGALVDGYVPMLYAADNGAHVINCSWGIPIAHAYEQAIVDAVWEAGVAIVAAGGTQSEVVYPAGYDHVFAVSATDPDDHRAPFAPYGETIDISAPGINILTIADGTLQVVSGTSFASGLVAGLAGLVHAANRGKDMSPSALLDAITSTAVDIDPLNPGYEGMLGAGRIDAAAAVGSVTSTPVDPVGLPHPSPLQCWPNPFTDSTWIRWEGRDTAHAHLDIFHADGTRALSVAQDQIGSGTFEWKAEDLPAGVYFVRLRSPAGNRLTTVTLVR